MPQPSVEHIAFILHKCREGSFRVCASRMYAFMQKSALDAHKLLGNNLVSTLADAGSMLDADKVFERLAHRNQQSWNALISGNIRHRKPELAFMLYLKMQDDDSVHPTVHTFLALLQVCAKTKDLERGLGLHAEILRIDLLKREPFVGSTLVVMYAECGSLAKSQEVFDQLFVHDVVSWNALITGYAQHRYGEEALHCFEQMKCEGFSPDSVTFACILKACGKIGAAEKGEMYFETMSTRYGIIPTLEHQTSMVVLFGHEGHFDKMMALIKKMPYFDCLSALVNACQKWGNTELGRLAFEHAVQFKESCDVPEVFMIQIMESKISRNWFALLPH
eukprot:c24906_g5_i1 orf=824-1825(+)